jgi:uncharacterized protein YlxW (UPF0749 family)
MSHPHHVAEHPPGPLPARVAIPLLDLITRESLDEDYQHVAERRSGEAAPASRTRSVLTVAAVLVFGLLVTIAAVQTSRNAPVDSEGKDQLIARIGQRRAAVARLQNQIAALRAANTKSDATYGLLGRELSAANTTRQALLANAGWAAVTGAGVRVMISDAPNGGEDGQVRASDLAGLVNGLWRAGATAIAINGQRVTALSALHNTGTVVRMNDNRAMSSPYIVLALGDTRTLQARFAQTTSGARLRDLTRQFGMGFAMQNEKTLVAPAAPSSMMELRHARAGHAQEPKSEKETP